MLYQCLNCQLSFEIKFSFLDNIKEKSKVFTCPNCRTLMFDVVRTAKIKDEVENLKEDVSPEKLNEIIRREKDILNKVKGTLLEDVKKYIVAFIKLIKDPNSNIVHKAIAAAALLYVLSPVDVIPDLIPIIGLSDDAVAVIIAVTMLGAALYNYLSVNNENTEHSILIYNVCSENEHIDSAYIEDKPLRIWSIYPSQLSKFGLKIMNDWLIKSPSLYVDHPYLFKTLIPMDDFDKTVEKSALNEEIKLFAAFGAKRIDVTHHEFRSASFDSDLDIKVCDEIIKGTVKAKGNKIKYDKFNAVYEFAYQNEYTLDVINELIWYFTNENDFESLLYTRCRNNMTSISLITESNTQNLFEIKNRNKLKKLNIGFDFSKHGAIYRKSEYRIEFYSKANLTEAESIALYSKINKMIDDRKSALRIKKLTGNE